MRRNTILSLLKEGKPVFKYPLKAVFLEGEGDVVVSVPKRNFKRAVKRNLLKRRIREAYRLNSSLLGDRRFDIFFHYVSPEIEKYEKIAESLRSILGDMASSKADQTL